MKDKELNRLIREHVRTHKEYDNVVYLKIIVVADEIRIDSHIRTPRELKLAKISMRNIKGEFIKESE